MPTVHRPETCPNCRAERDRQWVVQTVPAGESVKPPWQLDKRPRGDWKTVARPTRWTTLCLCDTP